MTQAQELVAEYRALLAAPGVHINTWKWAIRTTKNLEDIGKSTIGIMNSNRTAGCHVFRCADGSRFAFDLNGAQNVWAMPA
jgi:hypothetical protein